MRVLHHNHWVCDPSRFTHISFVYFKFSCMNIILRDSPSKRWICSSSRLFFLLSWSCLVPVFIFCVEIFCAFANFCIFASLLASYCSLFVASSAHFSTFLLCVHPLLVQFNIWFTCLSFCYIQSLRPLNRYLYSIPFIHYGPVINPAPFVSFPFPMVAWKGVSCPSRITDAQVAISWVGSLKSFRRTIVCLNLNIISCFTTQGLAAFL